MLLNPFSRPYLCNGHVKYLWVTGTAHKEHHHIRPAHVAVRAKCAVSIAQCNPVFRGSDHRVGVILTRSHVAERIVKPGNGGAVLTLECVMNF